jgi:hypothetical protein
MLLDQPGRAVEMNQQRHRFTNVDAGPGEEARAFQALQFNPPARNRRFPYARMWPDVLDHRRGRLRLLRKAWSLNDREYRDENEGAIHFGPEV